MITRTARFNINKEAALKRKIKTSNEEALVPKLEKGNNLRVFCNTTAKKMIQNTVSKSNKKKYLRNEDHDEKIRSESTRESKKSSQGEIK